MRATTRSLTASSLATAASLAVLVCSGSQALHAQDDWRSPEPTHGQHHRRPIVIEKQGSFFYGGRIITAPGTYDPAAFLDNTGDIFIIDKGYVSFQIPPNARRYPLIMVHGAGQTGKTYEDFKDREGYQSIFLRRGWSVYIPDFMTRGKAGFTSFTGPLGQLLGRQIGPDSTLFYGFKFNFLAFRLGPSWPQGGEPQYYPNTKFPQTAAALRQLAAQTVPFFELQEQPQAEVIGANIAALVKEIGPAILITHSQSGIFGFLAAIKSGAKVKGIIAYEGSGIFPEGEAPAGGQFPPITVPLADFEKLTRIPIQMVWGDNTTEEQLANNRAFVEVVNRHGGDAQLLLLPDVGLHGNTHFPFADLNNHKVADLLSQFLREKGLAKRSRHGADKDVATQ
jgi:pimeloyl-ACP methyl ester carboxylesterase